MQATMPGTPDIETGYVYANDAGDERLVVSVSHVPYYLAMSRRGRAAQPVVEWRTVDPNLPTGQKAQGSATLLSFKRWAVSSRKASVEDTAAFETLQSRRYWASSNKAAVRQIRKKLGTWPRFK